MFKFNRDEFINLFIEFSYLAIVFFIPIYFSFFLSTNNPFDLHKISLFKIFIFLLIFCSGFKLIFSKSFRKTSYLLVRKYFYIIFALLAFLFVSLLWSVDVYNSLFGSLSRQLGVLSYLFFITFSFLVAMDLLSSQNKSKKIKNILMAISLSSFFVSIYAVLQYFGIDFLTWEEPAIITKRSMSSLGQPNFLGSFLVLVIPLVFYLFMESRLIILKVIYASLFLLNFLALIFSASRGAWLALALAFLLFIFLFYFKKNNKRFYLGLLFLLLIIFSLIFINNSFSQRFKSAFDFSSGSSLARVVVWDSAIDFIKTNPWGLGLENQKEALVTYYQPNWATFSKVNTIFDRAHNIFLDHLLTIGIVGLFLFFIFYFFVFKIIFRNIINNRNPLLNKFIFFSISSYLISLFFNFAVVVTEIYFFLLIAIIISLNTDFCFFSEDANNIIKKKKNIFNYGLAFLLLLLCSFGISCQVRNVKADYYFNEYKRFFYSGEAPSAMVTFSYFLEQKSNFSSYYYDFISTSFDNFSRIRDDSSRFLTLEQIREVDLILNNKFNNNSFEYLFSKAQTSALLGDFTSSADFFIKLKYCSISYPDIYNKEARTQQLRGDIESALDNYYQVMFLLPDEDEVDGDINLKSLHYYKNFIKAEIDSLESI